MNLSWTGGEVKFCDSEGLDLFISVVENDHLNLTNHNVYRNVTIVHDIGDRVSFGPCEFDHLQIFHQYEPGITEFLKDGDTGKTYLYDVQGGETYFRTDSTVDLQQLVITGGYVEFESDNNVTMNTCPVIRSGVLYITNEGSIEWPNLECFYVLGDGEFWINTAFGNVSIKNITIEDVGLVVSQPEEAYSHLVLTNLTWIGGGFGSNTNVSIDTYSVYKGCDSKVIGNNSIVTVEDPIEIYGCNGCSDGCGSLEMKNNAVFRFIQNNPVTIMPTDGPLYWGKEKYNLTDNSPKIIFEPSSKLTINNDVYVSLPVEQKTGSNVTILGDNTLYITGDYVIEEGAVLHLEPNSRVVVNGTLTVYGRIEGDGEIDVIEEGKVNLLNESGPGIKYNVKDGEFEVYDTAHLEQLNVLVDQGNATIDGLVDEAFISIVGPGSIEITGTQLDIREFQTSNDNARVTFANDSQITFEPDITLGIDGGHVLFDKTSSINTESCINMEITKGEVEITTATLSPICKMSIEGGGLNVNSRSEDMKIYEVLLDKGYIIGDTQIKVTKHFNFSEGLINGTYYNAEKPLIYVKKEYSEDKDSVLSFVGSGDKNIDCIIQSDDNSVFENGYVRLLDDGYLYLNENVLVDSGSQTMEILQIYDTIPRFNLTNVKMNVIDSSNFMYNTTTYFTDVDLSVIDSKMKSEGETNFQNSNIHLVNSSTLSEFYTIGKTFVDKESVIDGSGVFTTAGDGHTSISSIVNINSTGAIWSSENAYVNLTSDCVGVKVPILSDSVVDIIGSSIELCNLTARDNGIIEIKESATMSKVDYISAKQGGDIHFLSDVSFVNLNDTIVRVENVDSTFITEYTDKISTCNTTFIVQMGEIILNHNSTCNIHSFNVLDDGYLYTNLERSVDDVIIDSGGCLTSKLTDLSAPLNVSNSFLFKEGVIDGMNINIEDTAFGNVYSMADKIIVNSELHNYGDLVFNDSAIVVGKNMNLTQHLTSTLIIEDASKLIADVDSINMIENLDDSTTLLNTSSIDWNIHDQHRIANICNVVINGEYISDANMTLIEGCFAKVSETGNLTVTEEGTLMGSGAITVVGVATFNPKYMNLCGEIYAMVDETNTVFGDVYLPDGAGELINVTIVGAGGNFHIDRYIQEIGIGTNHSASKIEWSNPTEQTPHLHTLWSSDGEIVIAEGEFNLANAQIRCSENGLIDFENTTILPSTVYFDIEGGLVYFKNTTDDSYLIEDCYINLSDGELRYDGDEIMNCTSININGGNRTGTGNINTDMLTFTEGGLVGKGITEVLENISIQGCSESKPCYIFDGHKLASYGNFTIDGGIINVGDNVIIDNKPQANLTFITGQINPALSVTESTMPTLLNEGNFTKLGDQIFELLISLNNIQNASVCIEKGGLKVGTNSFSDGNIMLSNDTIFNIVGNFEFSDDSVVTGENSSSIVIDDDLSDVVLGGDFDFDGSVNISKGILKVSDTANILNMELLSNGGETVFQKDSVVPYLEVEMNNGTLRFEDGSVIQKINDLEVFNGSVIFETGSDVDLSNLNLTIHNGSVIVQDDVRAYFDDLYVKMIDGRFEIGENGASIFNASKLDLIDGVMAFNTSSLIMYVDDLNIVDAELAHNTTMFADYATLTNGSLTQDGLTVVKSGIVDGNFEVISPHRLNISNDVTLDGSITLGCSSVLTIDKESVLNLTSGTPFRSSDDSCVPTVLNYGTIQKVGEDPVFIDVLIKNMPSGAFNITDGDVNIGYNNEHAYLVNNGSLQVDSTMNINTTVNLLDGELVGDGNITLTNNNSLLFVSQYVNYVGDINVDKGKLIFNGDGCKVENVTVISKSYVLGDLCIFEHLFMDVNNGNTTFNNVTVKDFDSLVVKNESHFEMTDETTIFDWDVLNVENSTLSVDNSKINMTNTCIEVNDTSYVLFDNATLNFSDVNLTMSENSSFIVLTDDSFVDILFEDLLIDSSTLIFDADLNNLTSLNYRIDGSQIIHDTLLTLTNGSISSSTLNGTAETEIINGDISSLTLGSNHTLKIINSSVIHDNIYFNNSTLLFENGSNNHVQDAFTINDEGDILNNDVLVCGDVYVVNTLYIDVNTYICPETQLNGKDIYVGTNYNITLLSDGYVNLTDISIDSIAKFVEGNVTSESMHTTCDLSYVEFQNVVDLGHLYVDFGIANFTNNATVQHINLDVQSFVNIEDSIVENFESINIDNGLIKSNNSTFKNVTTLMMKDNSTFILTNTNIEQIDCINLLDSFFNDDSDMLNGTDSSIQLDNSSFVSTNVIFTDSHVIVQNDSILTLVNASQFDLNDFILIDSEFTYHGDVNMTSDSLSATNSNITHNSTWRIDKSSIDKTEFNDAGITYLNDSIIGSVVVNEPHQLIFNNATLKESLIIDCSVILLIEEGSMLSLEEGSKMISSSNDCVGKIYNEGELRTIPSENVTNVDVAPIIGVELYNNKTGLIHLNGSDLTIGHSIISEGTTIVQGFFDSQGTLKNSNVSVDCRPISVELGENEETCNPSYTFTNKLNLLSNNSIFEPESVTSNVTIVSSAFTKMNGNIDQVNILNFDDMVINGTTNYLDITNKIDQTVIPRLNIIGNATTMFICNVGGNVTIAGRIDDLTIENKEGNTIVNESAKLDVLQVSNTGDQFELNTNTNNTYFHCLDSNNKIQSSSVHLNVTIYSENSCILFIDNTTIEHVDSATIISSIVNITKNSSVDFSKSKGVEAISTTHLAYLRIESDNSMNISKLSGEFAFVYTNVSDLFIGDIDNRMYFFGMGDNVAIEHVESSNVAFVFNNDTDVDFNNLTVCSTCLKAKNASIEALNFFKNEEFSFKSPFELPQSNNFNSFKAGEEEKEEVTVDDIILNELSELNLNSHLNAMDNCMASLTHINADDGFGVISDSNIVINDIAPFEDLCNVYLDDNVNLTIPVMNLIGHNLNFAHNVFDETETVNVLPVLQTNNITVNNSRVIGYEVDMRTDNVDIYEDSYFVIDSLDLGHNFTLHNNTSIGGVSNNWILEKKNILQGEGVWKSDLYVQGTIKPTIEAGRKLVFFNNLTLTNKAILEIFIEDENTHSFIEVQGNAHLNGTANVDFTPTDEISKGTVYNIFQVVGNVSGGFSITPTACGSNMDWIEGEMSTEIDTSIGEDAYLGTNSGNKQLMNIATYDYVVEDSIVLDLGNEGYLSPYGVDGMCCGSKGAPCKTLKYLLSRVERDSTVNLLPGIYNTSYTPLTLPLNRKININGIEMVDMIEEDYTSETENAVFDCNNSGDAIVIESAFDVVLSNFTINNCERGLVIHSSDINVSNVTLNNLTVNALESSFSTLQADLLNISNSSGISSVGSELVIDNLSSNYTYGNLFKLVNSVAKLNNVTFEQAVSNVPVFNCRYSKTNLTNVTMPIKSNIDTFVNCFSSSLSLNNIDFNISEMKKGIAAVSSKIAVENVNVSDAFMDSFIDMIKSSVDIDGLNIENINSTSDTPLVSVTDNSNLNMTNFNVKNLTSSSIVPLLDTKNSVVDLENIQIEDVQSSQNYSMLTPVRLVNTDVLMNNMTIKNVIGNVTGGLFSVDSNLVVNNSSFEYLHSEMAPGGCIHSDSQSKLNVSNSIFDTCSSKLFGGAIASSEIVSLTNNSFSQCEAGLNGGAVSILHKNSTCLDSKNHEYVCTSDEDFIEEYTDDLRSEEGPNVNNNIFIENVAPIGAGLFSNALNLSSIINNSFIDNVASNYGSNMTSDPRALHAEVSSKLDTNAIDLLYAFDLTVVDGFDKPIEDPTIRTVYGSPNTDNFAVKGEMMTQTSNGFAQISNIQLIGSPNTYTVKLSSPRLMSTYVDLIILVCEAGYGVLNGKCEPCAVGSYSPLPSAGACLSCDPGSWTETEGSKTCGLCRVGTFRNEDMTNGCERCPITSIADERGLTKCELCGENQRANEERTECQCYGNLYPLDNGECVPCPTGMYCYGGNNTCIKEGYFMNEAGVIVACVSLGCKGTCNNQTLQYGSCEEGYSGASCDVCQPGYFKSLPVCLECLPTPILLAIIALISVVQCIVLYIIGKDTLWNFSALSIYLPLIRTLQIFGSLHRTMPVHLPPTLQIFFICCDLLTLDIGKGQLLECVHPFFGTPEYRLIATAVSMLLLTVGSFIVFLKQKTDPKLSKQSRALRYLIASLLLLQTPLLHSAFEPFGLLSVGSNTVMQTYPNYLAFESEHLRLLGVGAFIIATFIGIELFLKKYHPMELTSIERDFQKETGDLLKPIETFYSHTREKSVDSELVSLTYQALLGGGLFILCANPLVQSLGGMVIAGFMMAYHGYKKPFKNERDNNFKSIYLVTTIMILAYWSFCRIDPDTITSHASTVNLGYLVIGAVCIMLLFGCVYGIKAMMQRSISGLTTKDQFRNNNMLQHNRIRNPLVKATGDANNGMNDYSIGHEMLQFQSSSTDDSV
eukprot:TRINITY_DN2866_c0_g1_i1.p1 TRINITY_DN2866_c0_g1~~TRINITY_DN2866_c0_g1_i1.p1  ORF type:complete len:4405 (+),score=1128.08 TRINITY_DN2866_c0_g1_i1:888-14102(+)